MFVQPIGEKKAIDVASFRATVDFTASQTAQTIYTPASGKKFVITDIIISASAAGAITVFDGVDNTGNRICKLNLAANDNGHLAFVVPIESGLENNVLKYTTGSGVAGSLTVLGYEI